MKERNHLLQFAEVATNERGLLFKVEHQVGNKPNWLQKLMAKDKETETKTGVQDQESETAETDSPKA